MAGLDAQIARCGAGARRRALQGVSDKIKLPRRGWSSPAGATRPKRRRRRAEAQAPKRASPRRRRGESGAGQRRPLAPSLAEARDTLADRATTPARTATAWRR
jgi:hypothetical protein